MKTEKEIRAEMRGVRAEMKAKKIRRISCFMGGHSEESRTLNAKMFELGVYLEDAKASAKASPTHRET